MQNPFRIVIIIIIMSYHFFWNCTRHQIMNSLKSFLLVMFTCLFSLSYSSLLEGSHKSNETDRAALLEFISWISDDPDQIFGSWNDTIDFCHWPGITCGHRHPRVTKLELPGLRLGGGLSPFIGNLSFLRIININNNGFTGEIPPEIGNLRRLTALRLDNNSFSGQLPENISGCTNLREIWLGNSKLVGEIPPGLAALSKLRFFLVHKNNFTGKFPDFFGNFSSLEFIGGEYNRFGGAIPVSLGRLQKLRMIRLGANFFSGTIPASIFNITSLTDLEFSVNELEGSLPLDLGITLPNLLNLKFGGNHLAGPIPPSIGNATNLLELQLTQNNFNGLVPDLKNLNRLRWFSVASNQLGSGTSGDLTFIESLNSTELWLLDFRSNNFGGALPQSIGNLSSNLNKLSFTFNRLTGTIPSSIGNLRNLEDLLIGWNPLTGILPEELGNLHKLKNLQAPYSRYSGEIPSSLGNLTMLTTLTLAGNKLGGSIPASLKNCQNLIRLDLSQNNLGGTIPSQVLGISSLSDFLDLSRNKLIGTLPDEIGDLSNLAILDVHENRLSGQVPTILGRCTSLVLLHMGNNMFEGNISSFLSPLRGLQYLDLSLNNFSNEIPKFLGNFQLTYLNLSFNRFEGEVPTEGVFLNATGISVMGNEKLCGGISVLNLPSCPTPKSKHKKKNLSKVIIATACGIVVFFVVLLLLATYICMKRSRRRNVKPHSWLVPIVSFPQISYEDILRATEGFNQNSLIGVGSFGSVYKGILGTDDNMVAIKVLDLQSRAASKSFLAECEALRNIRHRNLIKIYTACSTVDFQGNDFKALVYEYMENGSLEEWLHPKHATEGVYQNLSLIHRMSIAIDIACAVEYLHHECETPVIHCDLKPSNILLDAEMNAHVSDFGLARILSAADVILLVSSVGVRGTVGYSPPEYGMGSEVSREGDVYSYGILLLEMFTGKRPTADMFEGSWNIRCYCEAALPERAAEVTDPCLFSNEFGEGSSVRAPRRLKECMAKVLEIGIGCCRESPGERMDIREAAAKLRSLKPLAS